MSCWLFICMPVVTGTLTVLLEIIFFLTDVLRNSSCLNSEGSKLFQKVYLLYAKSKWFFFPWKKPSWKNICNKKSTIEVWNFSLFSIQQVSCVVPQTQFIKSLCAMCLFSRLLWYLLWWYWTSKITWFSEMLTNSFFCNSMEGVIQLNDICLVSHVTWASFKRSQHWEWPLFKKDSVLTSLCLVFEYWWNELFPCNNAIFSTLIEERKESGSLIS